MEKATRATIRQQHENSDVALYFFICTVVCGGSGLQNGFRPMQKWGRRTATPWRMPCYVSQRFAVLPCEAECHKKRR